VAWSALHDNYHHLAMNASDNPAWCCHEGIIGVGTAGANNNEGRPMSPCPLVGRLADDADAFATTYEEDICRNTPLSEPREATRLECRCTRVRGGGGGGPVRGACFVALTPLGERESRRRS
jgi:hypothetical protein